VPPPSPAAPTPIPSQLAIDTPYAVIGKRWSIGDALFLRHLADAPGGFVLEEQFPASETAGEALHGLGEVIARHERVDAETKATVRVGESLLLISIEHGFVELAASGPERAVRDAAAAAHRALGAPMPPAGSVPVSFWWLGGHGPRSRRRTIEVPSWEDVAGNYPAAPRAALDALMRAEQPPESGRLLLWHGPPGTGKSFAIRALMNEWRGWCAASFVTDPDQLFADSADYLATLMTAGDVAYRRPWRLLILEDAGELLTIDARERWGAGLSRLLNLSDGILGQGANLLVLITTNEPLGALHPAVHRAGRCWSEVALPPFETDEANAWLAGRGDGWRVRRPTPLAELFAPPEAREPDRPRFGFAA
jgi:hypothetical protein